MDLIITKCICCWFDFLGFGKPFVDTKWDLSDERCRKNYDRMLNAKAAFLSGSTVKPLGTKLVFNDGYASTIDLYNLNDVLIFMEGAINDFEIINYIDRAGGFPGIRGVISCGDRFSYDNSNATYDIDSKRDIAYYPREFQMNTAFSKAFIMEECGSRAGISGSELYIDSNVLSMIYRLAKDDGCDPPVIDKTGETIRIHLFDRLGWFADVNLENNYISFGRCKEYNNRGIETSLYRFKGIRSKIDEMAAEAARATAIRASLAEAEEHNNGDGQAGNIN